MIMAANVHYHRLAVALPANLERGNQA